MSVYPSALGQIARGNLDWERDPASALLVDDTASFNRLHTNVTDVKGELLDGTRVALTGTCVNDDGISRVVYSANNAVFSSQQEGQVVGGCVIYRSDTGALIAFVEGASIPTDGANVTVAFPSGVFGLSYA